MFHDYYFKQITLVQINIYPELRRLLNTDGTAVLLEFSGHDYNKMHFPENDLSKYEQR